MKKPVAWIKIYTSGGNYVASTVYYGEAAILCRALGCGTEARNGHAKRNVMWREGADSQESIDEVSEIMRECVDPDY